MILMQVYFEGWLYDNECLHSPTGIALDGSNVTHGVHDHMVACLLLESCIDSGYLLMQKDITGLYFPTVFFTQSSTDLIVAWLSNMTMGTNNVYVKVGAGLYVCSVFLFLKERKGTGMLGCGTWLSGEHIFQQ